MPIHVDDDDPGRCSKRCPYVVYDRAEPDARMMYCDLVQRTLFNGRRAPLCVSSEIPLYRKPEVKHVGSLRNLAEKKATPDET